MYIYNPINIHRIIQYTRYVTIYIYIYNTINIHIILQYTRYIKGVKKKKRFTVFFIAFLFLDQTL